MRAVEGGRQVKAGSTRLWKFVGCILYALRSCSQPSFDWIWSTGVHTRCGASQNTGTASAKIMAGMPKAVVCGVLSLDGLIAIIRSLLQMHFLRPCLRPAQSESLGWAQGYVFGVDTCRSYSPLPQSVGALCSLPSHLPPLHLLSNGLSCGSTSPAHLPHWPAPFSPEPAACSEHSVQFALCLPHALCCSRTLPVDGKWASDAHGIRCL